MSLRSFQDTRPSRQVEEPTTCESVLDNYGLVLNGGGVKGTAFVGALLEFDKRVNVRFSTFCGTSAGAIAAAILAMGYSAETTAAIIRKQSLQELLSKNWSPQWNIPPWEACPQTPGLFGVRRIAQYLLAALKEPFVWLRLILPFLKGSLYSSAAVGRFLQYLERWRPLPSGAARLEPDPTLGGRFRDLPFTLTVVASSTGPQNTHIFASGSDEVEFAVRCSMAIPGFFERQTLGRDVLYDGGLVANFAFDEFTRLRPTYRVLGFYLYDGEEVNRASDQRSSILSVLNHVLRIYQGQDQVATIQEDHARIVRIDTSPIHTIDFGLSDTDKDLLVASGRLAVLRFLLEEDHDLPLRRGQEPSNDEYRVLLKDVQYLRTQARARWKWRHRFRLWRMYAAIVMTVLLILTPVAIGGVVTAYMLRKPAPEVPPPLLDRQIINIGLILNGNAEYAQTAAEAFRSELEKSLSGTRYVAHFEQIIGHPESSASKDNIAVLEQFLKKFSNGPDYLVPVGTQVAKDVRDQYLGKIPIVFLAVTDAVASKIVGSMEADQNRGNICGVVYAPASHAAELISSTFPGSKLGFVYQPAIPQDVIVCNQVMASKSRGISIVPLAVDERGNFEHNVDIIFGWYYVTAHFDRVQSSGLPVVAGNENDMTRGAIALIANNDKEAGELGASEIVAPALLKGTPLWSINIMRCSHMTLGINRGVARRHGIRIAKELPPRTYEYD